ncbi:hypothetical protein IWW36_004666 [Coemansia brasiliensis]|uniref:RRN7-type domain-containing protein n=1 Tax=Coemansia brasiliensis TaxID=2650707 RepID=A0A9W8I597_9FUNG|nr:hypothetical protein IWW36_004666 [Coemansia brasiliensis]
MESQLSFGGSIQKNKRRCTVCGTRKFAYRDDGRLMCKHGHEQMDFVEEEAEGIIEGSTRRHIKGNKRVSKRKQEREHRLHGRNANFILIQGMQFIIKLQATKLAEMANLPDSYVGTVKKLWLLYVSKLDDVNYKDMTETDVLNMYLSAHSQDKWTQDSSQASGANFSQPSQEAAVDTGSLDFLMQKVDEDIAKDVEEMRLWEQQDEDSVAASSSYMGTSQDNSENEDMSLADGEYTSQSIKSNMPRANRRTGVKSSKSEILKHIETFVSLEYLPVILYIALLWLRIPAQLADLHYLMADERVPYVSAYQYLPAEITGRLGDGLLAVFKRPYPPSINRMRSIMASFPTFYQKHYGLEIPRPNSPLLLLSIIKRLGLCIDLYLMVMKIIGLTQLARFTKTSCGQTISIYFTAAIVVCLKMHYGLDEIERKSPTRSLHEEIYELNLPPLNEFMAEWRSSWMSELSIGAIPYLTAFDKHWENEFAEYYRRLAHRPELPKHKLLFKKLGSKYTQVLDDLAVRDLAPEAATALLPSTIIRRISNSANQQDGTQQAEQPRPHPLSLEALVEPLYKNPVKVPLEGREEKLMLMSNMAMPFDNPELSLKRGEFTMSFADGKNVAEGHGYINPVFGMVIARCSMMLGCSQSRLLTEVGHFDTCLQKLFFK